MIQNSHADLNLILITSNQPVKETLLFVEEL